MAEQQCQKAVLIVEDDDGWARLISDEVADAGFRPVRVSTVDEARGRLEQGSDASLVVLDVLFGERAEPLGLDFARWLHHDRRWRNLPIVFCTVVGMEEITAKLGLKDVVFFQKPIVFREFSDKIKAILAKGAA